jgi:hypothetical protein
LNEPQPPELTTLITDLGYPDAQFLVPVHDHTVEWLVKDVRYTGRDVREKAHRISNEIGGTKYAVELAQYVLSVMVRNSVLELGHGQTHVFDGQSIHFERSVVDVAHRHGNGINHDS